MIKKIKPANKTAGFSKATSNAEIKTIIDRPRFIVRAYRWIFNTAPRAVWKWIVGLEIAGLCNMAMLLLIIILFSFLIGQATHKSDCNRKNLPDATITNVAETASDVMMPEIIEKNDNVEIINKPADMVIDNNAQQMQIVVTKKKTTIILPMKIKSESQYIGKFNKPSFVKINGNVVIDGGRTNKYLSQKTIINGDLILQNMNSFTLPCGVKVNGNLIVRNVRNLDFCGCFAISGDIYVSSNSSFGPIPRDAYINGQVIF